MLFGLSRRSGCAKSFAKILKTYFRSIIVGLWGLLVVPVFSQEVVSESNLSPSDLDMLKLAFSASPTAEQVAVFRMDASKEGKVQTKYTISYSPVKEVKETILLVDYSFFDSSRGAEYSLKLPSWSFKIEKMIQDGYKFGPDGKGEIKFRGVADKKGENAIFRFEISLLSYQEAKLKFPDLPDKNGSWTWASKVEETDLDIVSAEAIPSSNPSQSEQDVPAKSDRAGG